MSSTGDQTNLSLSANVSRPCVEFEVASDTWFLLGLDQIIIAIVLCVFIVTAVAGNILVIIAILTDRNLRKAGNYFLVSLAMADTFVACFVMTFAMINDVLGKWSFGPSFCKIWMSADVMCSTASILNLCAISLDRYLHIRSPLHYDAWVDHFRVLFVVATIWVMSALISFLPIQLDWHRLGLPDLNLNSDISTSGFQQLQDHTASHFYAEPDGVCQLELNPVYAVVSSTISFYLPCLAMTLIYYRLLQYARRHVTHIKMTTKFSSSAVQVQQCGSSTTTTTLYKTSDHKAAITLGIIMGVFLVCWVPFFTVNVVGAFCRCVPPLVFGVFTWLGYVNSTMNPVIYGVFNRQFRDAFKKVLSTFMARICGRKYRQSEGGMPMQNFTPPNRSCQLEDRLEANHLGVNSSVSNNRLNLPTSMKK